MESSRVRSPPSSDDVCGPMELRDGDGERGEAPNIQMESMEVSIMCLVVLDTS